MFLSGQEIYDNFKAARGPGDLASGAEVVAEVVGKYNERGDRIKKILGKMDAVWQGDAAGAAHRGAGPLAVEHALAAPAMDGMRDLASRQAGSFNDAKNAVVPVPPAPETVDPLAAFLAPGELVTYQQQLGRHNSAAQQNADVMRGYENASVYNMNLPSTYGSITADQSEIRVGQAAPPPPGPGDGPRQPGPGTRGPRAPAGGGGGGGVQPGGAGSGSGGPGTGVPGVGGPGDGPGGGGGTVTPPPGRTTPNDYVPPIPGPGPGVGVPNPPVGPVSGSGPGGPGSGFVGTGIGPVGVPGAGSGSGSGGVGGRGGAGTGGLGGGGRMGAGPLGGGMAGDAAGVRGAPAGRGGPGGVPLGAGAGGRGRGGDDEEHERASFLEEPDPEAVFGTDERTPPPVIGA